MAVNSGAQLSIQSHVETSNEPERLWRSGNFPLQKELDSVKKIALASLLTLLPAASDAQVYAGITTTGRSEIRRSVGMKSA